MNENAKRFSCDCCGDEMMFGVQMLDPETVDRELISGEGTGPPIRPVGYMREACYMDAGRLSAENSAIGTKYCNCGIRIPCSCFLQKRKR